MKMKWTVLGIVLFSLIGAFLAVAPAAQAGTCGGAAWANGTPCTQNNDCNSCFCDWTSLMGGVCADGGWVCEHDNGGLCLPYACNIYATAKVDCPLSKGYCCPPTKKKLGENCSITSDCETGLICFNGVCEYPETTCKAQPSGHCDSLNNCSGRQSYSPTYNDCNSPQVCCGAPMASCTGSCKASCDATTESEVNGPFSNCSQKCCTFTGGPCTGTCKASCDATTESEVYGPFSNCSQKCCAFTGGACTGTCKSSCDSSTESEVAGPFSNCSQSCCIFTGGACTGTCKSSCNSATESEVNGPFSNCSQACCVTNPPNGSGCVAAGGLCQTDACGTDGAKSPNDCGTGKNCCAYGTTVPKVVYGGWSLNNISNRGLTAGPSRGIIGIGENFLAWILLIMGFIGLIVFIIAGIIYITSTGDEERIQWAKRILTYAIIGTIISMIGFVIVKTIAMIIG